MRLLLYSGTAIEKLFDCKATEKQYKDILRGRKKRLMNNEKFQKYIYETTLNILLEMRK